MNHAIAQMLRERIAGPGRRVLFVCGLPGAGKTTFCKTYATATGLTGPIIHQDWFLEATAVRKRRIAEALASGDPERIELAENPRNWYDAEAFQVAVRGLRETGRLTVSHGWNQATGDADLDLTLTAGPDDVIWCDGIQMLHPGIAELADVIVRIDVLPELAHQRQTARDGHRNDPEYLAYKVGLFKKYEMPYFAQYGKRADIAFDSTALTHPETH